MISLRHLLEYATLQGQSYDLGTDFANFQRMVDGTTNQVRQKFEASINAKLQGKRIRARAARQYHNFEKDYEFDVSRVTIEDYFDNFVVVAHDESGKKPKEYFLRPGVKIQIVGLASGQPIPMAKPGEPYPQLPKVNASPDESIPTDRQIPVRMKEEAHAYDAYQIDSIIDDIKPWATRIMKDPRLGARSFVKGLGWMKPLPNGKTKIVYDLMLPKENIKFQLTNQQMASILKSVNRTNGNVQTQFDLVGFKPTKEGYAVRIAKYIHNPSSSNTTSTKPLPENV